MTHMYLYLVYIGVSVYLLGFHKTQQISANRGCPTNAVLCYTTELPRQNTCISFAVWSFPWNIIDPLCESMFKLVEEPLTFFFLNGRSFSK